jgi:hypothetical protein
MLRLLIHQSIRAKDGSPDLTRRITQLVRAEYSDVTAIERSAPALKQIIKLPAPAVQRAA